MICRLYFTLFLSLIFLGFTCKVGDAQIRNSEIRLRETFSTLGNINDTHKLQQWIDSFGFYQYTAADSGLIIYQYLAKQSQKVNYIPGVLKTKVILSGIYRKRGDFRQALSLLLKCKNIIERHPQYKPSYLAALYTDIASCYKSLGNRELAAEYYYQALEAGKQFPEFFKSEAAIYQGLAAVINDEQRALAYLQKAFTLSRRQQDFKTLGTVLLNLSVVYQNNKNWEASKEVLQEAFLLARDKKDTLLQFRALVSMASLRLHLGEYRQAETYMRSARLIYPQGQSNDAAFQYYTDYLTGEIYMRLQQYGKAINYLNKTLAAAKEMGDKEMEAEAYSTLAFIYGKTGHYRQAWQHEMQYKRLKDSVFNARIAKDIHNLEIKYNTTEKDKQIAIERRKNAEKNMIIGGTTGGMLILLLLIWVLKRQSKQKHKLYLQGEEIIRLRAIMNGEEKERSRIAGELHDGIGSMLAALKMAISNINPFDQDEKDKVRKALAMTEETALEVRRTSHNLIPGMLEIHRLEEALAIYCDNLREAAQLDITFQLNGSIEDLSKPVEIIIYRMVQELLQNAVKHADATKIYVQLSRHTNSINIMVEDNGKGILPAEGGIGLYNLQYKVETLHGTMSVDSIEGEYTTVCIEFDLDKLLLIV